MPMIVTCRICGAEHEPSPEAVRAGQWRTCERCRELEEAFAERLVADERVGKKARVRDWQRAARTVRKAG